MPLYNNKHFAYSHYALNNFGIDKIRIHTRDFEVKDTLCLGVQPNSKQQGLAEAEPTFLFNTTKQGGVYGKGAYYNNEDINLDISTFGLSLVFNPTKYKGANQLTADTHHISLIAQDIEDHLQDLGIRLSISNSKATRIDLAKDRLMDKEVFMYGDTFNTLTGKRAKERVQYPDGYRIGNGQRQGLFYDKGFEQSQQRSNNMRCEYRLLKSAAISKALSITRLEDIYKATPEDLHYLYGIEVSNNILNTPKTNNNTRNISLQGLQHLRQVVSSGGRYYQKDLFALSGGVSGLLDMFGSFDNIRNFIISCGKKRQNADSIIKDLKHYLQQSNGIMNSTIGLDLEEIKQKFVA